MQTANQSWQMKVKVKQRLTNQNLQHSYQQKAGILALDYDPRKDCTVKIFIVFIILFVRKMPFYLKISRPINPSNDLKSHFAIQIISFLLICNIFYHHAWTFLWDYDQNLIHVCCFVTKTLFLYQSHAFILLILLSPPVGIYHVFSICIFEQFPFVKNVLRFNKLFSDRLLPLTDWFLIKWFVS